MTYVGSKRRLAKYIAPIIQKCIDEHNIKNYYEPFVGGANMTEHIVCQNRYGNDIHKELIAMFKELQKGTPPPKRFHEKSTTECSETKQIILIGM